MTHGNRDFRQSPLWPLVANAAADEGNVWLRWLVRLRWVAILAQIITLSFSFSVLASPILVFPLAVVILLIALGNLRAVQLLSRPSPVGEDVLLAQLCVDVLGLTAFFFLAGGPDNPFTILYVVHVAMGSVMLSSRRAAVLVAVVLACYGSLHAEYVPLRLGHHTLGETTLVNLGRVVSFAIASASVALFVAGLATTLRRRSRQLLEARDRTARTDRLRSVGTLAAGAAHELNTPLSTLGLRVRRIGRRHGDADTTRDLEVMTEQLDRCRRVVDRLLVGAGDPSASGIERQPLATLVADAIELWSKGSTVQAQIHDAANGMEIEVPRVAFLQALINLLENAREAQEDLHCPDPIDISIDQDGGYGVIRIQDRGCGLPDHVDRVGEPFFTTKSTGTGLGVFVARAVADGAGGGLSYSPRTGGGTTARWWFPEATRRSA